MANMCKNQVVFIGMFTPKSIIDIKSIQGCSVVDESENHIEIEYDTKWSPNGTFIESLARINNLDYRHYYHEPSSKLCGLSIKSQGVYVHSRIEDWPTPQELEGQESEEEYLNLLLKSGLSKAIYNL